MPHLYRPMLRPAGRSTLPDGIRWDYHEAPAMFGIASRTDLPRSTWRYGIIATDRELTPEEISHFDLEAVPYSSTL